jgi:hypothetical protein
MREKLWMPDLIRTEMAKAGGEEDERAAKKLGKKFEWKLLFAITMKATPQARFNPSPFEEAAILTNRQGLANGPRAPSASERATSLLT